MKLARTVILGVAGILVIPTLAAATLYRAEHVTGGNLDLVWAPGFGVTATAQPLTLLPTDPAFANPSGDHTVLVATNMPVDSGGIILTATDPAGQSDYSWEGWMFTGDGNTRRGLVVRADPTNGFTSSYQFVIQSGLFQLNFRKLINSAPTTLGTWFANTLPGGAPLPNTWHRIAVVAVGSSFRCFWDGFELTAGSPIMDTSIPTGWVGVYNFRFDLGSVPVYFDDLLLFAPDQSTPATHTSFGQLKARYRN